MGGGAPQVLGELPSVDAAIARSRVGGPEARRTVTLSARLGSLPYLSTAGRFPGLGPWCLPARHSPAEDRSGLRRTDWFARSRSRRWYPNRAVPRLEPHEKDPPCGGPPDSLAPLSPRYQGRHAAINRALAEASASIQTSSHSSAPA
jgi:hypothetical protein